MRSTEVRASSTIDQARAVEVRRPTATFTPVMSAFSGMPPASGSSRKNTAS